MTVPTGRYDNNKMNVLQAALNQACKELCISKSDQVSRKRVAALVVAFAEYGDLDVDKLKTFAVRQF